MTGEGKWVIRSAITRTRKSTGQQYEEVAYWHGRGRNSWTVSGEEPFAPHFLQQFETFPTKKAAIDAYRLAGATGGGKPVRVDSLTVATFDEWLTDVNHFRLDRYDLLNALQVDQSRWRYFSSHGLWHCWTTVKANVSAETTSTLAGTYAAFSVPVGADFSDYTVQRQFFALRRDAKTCAYQWSRIPARHQ